MKQIERLISRLVQLAEDGKGQRVTLTFIIDGQGNIVGWDVAQFRLEGINYGTMTPTTEAAKPARKKSSDTQGK